MDQLVTKIQLAEDSKKTARFFTYGNLLAITFPALFVLWFGASILVYAICRHHPNPRVGFYTQRAAYCYYAVAGLLVPCLAFSPEGFIKTYWLLVWAVCALIILTFSVVILRQISRELWQDIEYKGKA